MCDKWSEKRSIKDIWNGNKFQMYRDALSECKFIGRCKECEKEIKDDVKDNLKILVNDYLRKIDVVTREEFDVQKEVLLKTRKKLDELEEKLNK